MISVSVGGKQMTLDKLREGWLLEQLERQGSNRSAVCVRVEIDEGPIECVLTTPGCGTAPGGRPPRAGGGCRL